MSDAQSLQNTQVYVYQAKLREHAYPGDTAVVLAEGALQSAEYGSTITCIYTGDALDFTVTASDGTVSEQTSEIKATYYAPDAILVKVDSAPNYGSGWLLVKGDTANDDSYMWGSGFLASANPEAYNWWPAFTQPYTDDDNSNPDDPSVIPRPCYLAGVQIQAGRGILNVEDIKPGDSISTWSPSLKNSRRQQVIWCGYADLTVREDLPDDIAGWPVRICKGAIASNVPSRDLRVTGEHGLYLQGRFVPARMLVNGMTILFDKTVKNYRFYHIETEKHAIIKADGAFSETYLDVGGNRQGFATSGNVIPLSRDLSWEKDGAAPVAYERDFVEPIFQMLKQRAFSLGFTETLVPPELTNEHDVHLLTDGGMRINPSRDWNGHVSFVIPPGVVNIRIMSRKSRPSDVIGPFENQRNALGVAIGQIHFFENNRHMRITQHLTTQHLSGWYNLEWEDTRWTRGNGWLSLDRKNLSMPALLSLHIKAAGPYLVKSALHKVRSA